MALPNESALLLSQITNLNPLLLSVCRCWKQYRSFYFLLRMTTEPWKRPGKWPVQLIILFQALKKNVTRNFSDTEIFSVTH